MKKIILQQFVTIDGFAAEAGGGMNFITNYAAKNDRSYQADAEQFLDSVDTMILGANTYKIFSQYWPGAAAEVGVFAEKLNALSKFVASSTLESAPWGEWPGAEIMRKPSEKIVQLKKQSGKNIVIWGSLVLSQSLMKNGLIDEYQLRVCPEALGSGEKLFDDGIKDMELLEAKAYDKGMVLLRYAPRSEI